MQINKASVLLFFLICISTAGLNAQETYDYPTFRHKLDSLVKNKQLQQSCYYHFARLYQRVSIGVAALTKAGKLKDTVFIAKLEGRFGYYFLKNFDSLNNSVVTNYCWQQALDTQQHTNHYATPMIMAMSAHITHDLFFALTDIFKTQPPTKANKKDYKLVAKVHEKIIADYFENIMPHLKADKKWKRQSIRKLSKQAAKGLRMERNRVWNEAKKAAENPKKFAKYYFRHMALSHKMADRILKPKGLLKTGIEIADTLDSLTFEEKAFLLNNARP
ncbi:DUF5995 family protein [Oscillatoria amoena NRMC-F 0135]|nr:DUF5995 family protein [Oscillatoria amoena NRMC-F 0135]